MIANLLQLRIPGWMMFNSMSYKNHAFMSFAKYSHEYLPLLLKNLNAAAQPLDAIGFTMPTAFPSLVLGSDALIERRHE